MEELYNSGEVLNDGSEDAKSDEYVDPEEVTGEYETDDVLPKGDASESTGIDYESLIAEDVETLKSEFPELRGINDITDLNNPIRYAALRDLGLSAVEAYLATAKRKPQDTRSHLRSAHGRNAGAPNIMMSQYELRIARELFPGMNDSEIQRLYKKVTK